MKVLVAFESHHNSTLEIADAIADELRAAGLEADTRSAETVATVTGYDAVVLGSAVYMGGWMSQARKLVIGQSEALKRVPVWLFSSGPIGSPDLKPHGEPEHVAEYMESTGARGHKVFSGRLKRRLLGPAERLAAMLVQAPEGDFRDWTAIREWARNIAMELATRPSAVALGRKKRQLGRNDAHTEEKVSA